MPQKLLNLARPIFSSVTCLLAILANTFAIAIPLPYTRLPAGEWTNTIGETSLLSLLALLTLIFGIGTLWLDLRRHKPKPALIGFLFCLTPIYLGWSLIQCIARLKGLVLLNLDH